MLADTLVETEAELFGDTSKYVPADTQVNKLYYNLVEAEVQTISDRQSDVKFEAMGMLHSR